MPCDPWVKTKKIFVNLLNFEELWPKQNYIHNIIMEYGSTPYIGMAPKQMAAPLYVYKVICSKVCPRLSHKLLWTIPVIKGGGSREATGALAPPIAKVGGLSPPKIEVNAPPTYFELRHCHVEMAGSRDVCAISVEFFRCICSLIL